MKFWILSIFITFSFTGCVLNDPRENFTNSSIQTVDMGTFKGLRTIEIASLNFPEGNVKTQNGQIFTEVDQDNFSDSLIRSLKKSDVRVLPSAQTKIHIDFTQLAMPTNEKDSMMIMNAEIAVSRNGIITRKSIEINGKPKLTTGSTKDNGVKMFIQKLGDLLREQSSFKR